MFEAVVFLGIFLFVLSFLFLVWDNGGKYRGLIHLLIAMLIVLTMFAIDYLMS